MTSVKSVDAKFREMEEKLARATVKIFVGDRNPWTGTIVASKSGQSIIFTVAHCLDIPGMSLEEVEDKLVVMFYEDDMAYPATICCSLFKSEMALLRVDKGTPANVVLDFAPRGQWNLTRLQPIVAMGHPEGTTYRSDKDEICSAQYLNTTEKYDKNMMLFDHRLDLVGGCSGAAIVSEYGNIIGLQSGRYTSTVDVMGSRPFDNLLRAREQELIDAFEARKPNIQHHNMAQEMQSLNDAMGRVTANFSDGNFRRSDIIPLTSPTSNMKIAIHIKYINSALREKLFGNNLVRPLQELIQQKYLPDAGSSSGARK